MGINETIQTFFQNTFNWRTLAVFVVALGIAWLITRFATFVVLKAARAAQHAGEVAKGAGQTIRLRQIETYLSIFIAFIRIIVFGTAIIIAWQYTHPTTTSLTVIGASTIFFVLAGATLAPTLRDLTAGTLMIVEKWYNVGDYITVDPYLDESGIVERMNLRSTRIRKLNGEVLWIHNQHIQRVSVAPNGVHTMSLDIFVSDKEQGLKMVEHLKSILTVGPTMLAAPLELIGTEQITDELWRITVVGQTTPSSEWLMRDFAIDILKQYDEKYKKKKLLIYKPVTRYADRIAERRFKRAIQMNIASLAGDGKRFDAIDRSQKLIKKMREQDRKRAERKKALKATREGEKK